MKHDLNLLRDFFKEDNEKLIKDMTKGYLDAFTQGIALTNISFTLYLLYKGAFKENKTDIDSFTTQLLGELHTTICDQLTQSVFDLDNDILNVPEMKEDIDGLVTKVREAMETTYDGIKNGILQSLHGSITMFEKLGASSSTVPKPQGSGDAGSKSDS